MGCRPVGGADPIGGNVLKGAPMYAVDFCSGGASSIARFCFFGIGGRVSFTFGLKKRKRIEYLVKPKNQTHTSQQ